MKFNHWLFLGMIALVWVPLAPAGSASALPLETLEAQLEPIPDGGEVAYRAGNYKQALSLWRGQLESLADQPGNGGRIGELCYNLGNAAYRDGEGMQALAWYTAARRHAPRDGDLLANLKFVRGELGLPPEDSSGLLATVGSSLRSWTPRESKNFAWIGVLLLAAAMGYEALRGGVRGRNGVLVALGLCTLLWLPFLRHSLAGDSTPHMVIAERGTNGRSEPRPDAKTLVHLEPTAIADRLDVWQDWTQLRTTGGEVVWVSSSKVMSIDW